MTKKSRFTVGQIIKIIGYRAGNPNEDEGQTVRIMNIIKQRRGEDQIFYLRVDGKSPQQYYALERDCTEYIDPNEDNIISRKIREGDTSTLLEMKLIDINNNITSKGYEFLKKFN